MNEIPDHKIKYLYVTGDSFSFGHGLPGHDINRFYDFNETLRHTCYSGIIADKWNIPQYENTSMPGCSNDRLVRKIMDDIPRILKSTPAENIFVNISFTHSARTEFYSIEAKKYIPVITNFDPKGCGFKSHELLWNLYVTHFDSLTEHVDRWLRNLMTIQQFLKSLGIRYVITKSMGEHFEFWNELQKRANGLKELIDGKTYNYDMLPFNVWLQSKGIPMTPCHHPTELGHEAWAEYLMQYLIDKQFI